MSDVMAQKKKSGCGKKLAIGCFTVIVLLAAGSFFAYRGATALAAKLTAEYADTAPAVLPAVEASEADKAALFQRVDAFAKAVQAGQPTPELTLSAQDINVLIQKSPQLANKLYVTLDGDRIQGEASFPLEELGGLFKGRWLNGAASFRVDTAAGRLVVFMDSLSVRGKPLPEALMSTVRTKNLAEKAMENPQAAAALHKLDSVKVSDGKLVIKAK